MTTPSNFSDITAATAPISCDHNSPKPYDVNSTHNTAAILICAASTHSRGTARPPAFVPTTPPWEIPRYCSTHPFAACLVTSAPSRESSGFRVDARRPTLRRQFGNTRRSPPSMPSTAAITTTRSYFSNVTPVATHAFYATSIPNFDTASIRPVTPCDVSSAAKIAHISHGCELHHFTALLNHSWNPIWRLEHRVEDETGAAQDSQKARSSGKIPEDLQGLQVVGAAGLEPTTPGFGGRYSIQMSYAP